MFIVEFLPDWVFHLFTVLSIGALLITIFLGNIPVIGKYARQIQFISFVCAVAGVWFEGGIANNHRWEVKLRAAEKAALVAEAQAAEANKKLAEVLAQHKQDIVDVNNTNRKRIRELESQINQTVKINQETINILNDAARNTGGAK